jgi:hypothetical protein
MSKKHSPALLVVLVTSLASPLLAADVGTAGAAPPAASAESMAGDPLPGEVQTPCVDLGVGSRVRLRGRGLPRGEVVGGVVAADAQSVTIVRGPASARAPVAGVGSSDRLRTRIPFSQVERLDVAFGTRSLAREGALIGAAVPAAISLVCFAVGGASESHGAVDNTGLRVGVWAAVAVGPGAILGALLGASTTADRWQRACGQHVRVTIVPGLRGGARARLAVRF